MTRSVFLTTFLLSMLVAPPPGSAQSPEWPGLYFERCGKCHGDAHSLLDKQATLRDGEVVGRGSGRDLRAFLGNHFAQRDKSEVETVYMELLRVAQGGGRFKRQCAICHISAERLARGSLIERDGELFGRYTGRRIIDFLLGHGRLETRDDAVFFVEVLRRNLPR